MTQATGDKPAEERAEDVKSILLLQMLYPFEHEEVVRSKGYLLLYTVMTFDDDELSSAEIATRLISKYGTQAIYYVVRQVLTAKTEDDDTRLARRLEVLQSMLKLFTVSDHELRH